MGNTEAVLPPGVVCDRCNHEVLSGIDAALCDFIPVKLRRTVLGIPSKNGTIPTTRLTKGTLSFIPGENGADPTLFINENSGRRPMVTTEPMPDGRVELTMKMRGGKPLKPAYSSKLSRALLKCAMEYGWLEHGEQMLDASYDHIRDAVLGEPRDGFFAMVKRADPNHAGTVLTYNIEPWGDGESRMYVGLLYAGVALLTDSRLATLSSEYDGLVDSFPFEASQLPKRKV